MRDFFKTNRNNCSPNNVTSGYLAYPRPTSFYFLTCGRMNYFVAELK